MSDHYDALLGLIYSNSFQYSEEPVFLLASGQKSSYYFNCKATSFDPLGQHLIGNLFFERIKNLQIDAIGGLTMGADPIAIATSLTSYQKEKPIKAFSIRKEPKKHGLQLWIEGNLKAKDNAIIVEDVITTGGSAIKAIERVKEIDVNVVSVVALIDREEGGREAIEQLGVPVESIFTKSDIMAFHKGPSKKEKQWGSAEQKD